MIFFTARKRDQNTILYNTYRSHEKNFDLQVYKNSLNLPDPKLIKIDKKIK